MALDAITKKQIKAYILDYLKARIPNFVQSSQKGLFTCPRCKQLSANIYPPKSGIVHCFTPECGKQGDIFDICRAIDFNGQDIPDEDLADLLIQELGIKTDKEIQQWLERYQKWGWSLVPVEANSKRANVEKDWQNKIHKSITEWQEWIGAGLNVGCFDKETEILTDKGWKFFKDLDKTEKVMTLDWKTNKIQFVKPLYYMKYLYNGKMYQIKSNTIDMCVTPNHNIYYRQHSSDKYDLKRMDMINVHRFEIPITGNWDGENKEWFYLPSVDNKFSYNIEKILMRDWLEFLGWFISEGCLVETDYKICICQHKNNTRKEIEKLLKRMNLNFCYTNKTFEICNKQIYFYLKNNTYFINENSKIRTKSVYCSYNKSVPEFIKTLNSSLIQVFITALVKGDGYKSKRTERYYTSSKKLSHDVQELYLKLGFSTFENTRLPRIHHYNGKIITGRENQYEIIKQTRQFRTVFSKNISQIPYNDFVYCVEVPTGIIFVRRNRHCYWSGNSKSGKDSNLTLIDIDTKDVPDDLKKYINNTLTQETQHGFHLCYFYEPDLPSINLRTTSCKLPVEIRNEGNQTVIYPSVVEDKERKWNDKEPIKMPEELKKWLLEKIVVKEEVKQILTAPTISLDDLKIKGLDGKCNSSFVKLGGLLRKQLNISQTEYALNLLNDLLLDNPMSKKDISGMIKELKKYSSADYSVLTKQILEYLTKHNECSVRDLQDVLKAEKKDIMECIAQLILDNKIYKQRTLYKAILKPDWKTEFLAESQIVDFNVPYFSDIATFRRGDMICLGAGTGIGKGHICMNIIKKYVEQGIKPFYVSSEPGNRFATIAMRLGLREGDFNFCNHYHPEKLELEDDAVTFYDWILPEEFSGTANLYKLFAHQLDKHKGILYVLSQLNDSTGDFYASSMVRFFSSMAVKYYYTKVNNITDNTNTYFKTSKIRESKNGVQEITIPMKYNPDTKVLELRKP